jgi:hypothetical protein
MPDRTEEKLHALAHAVIENKGLLKTIADQANGELYKRAIKLIIAAADEVEEAWNAKIRAAE